MSWDTQVIWKMHYISICSDRYGKQVRATNALWLWVVWPVCTSGPSLMQSLCVWGLFSYLPYIGFHVCIIVLNLVHMYIYLYIWILVLVIIVWGHLETLESIVPVLNNVKVEIVSEATSVLSSCLELSIIVIVVVIITVIIISSSLPVPPLSQCFFTLPMNGFCFGECHLYRFHSNSFMWVWTVFASYGFVLQTPSYMISPQKKFTYVSLLTKPRKLEFFLIQCYS